MLESPRRSRESGRGLVTRIAAASRTAQAAGSHRIASVSAYAARAGVSDESELGGLRVVGVVAARWLTTRVIASR